jgi:iron-sulfur cluster insertion protein
MTEQLFHVSDAAAKQIVSLATQEGNKTPLLRIAVNSGGCYGMQYSFDLVDEIKDTDMIFDHENAKVVMDDLSLNFLNGSTLDYVDDMMGSFFTINNPNATSSCGCGNSFSI